jgi:uncharacterized membrane-anchored protein
MRFSQKIKTIFLTFFLTTSIAFAANDADNPYDISSFDSKVPLTSGSIYPNYAGAFKFGNKGACRLAKEIWGWSDSSCDGLDKLLIETAPNIDTLVIEYPQSIGYVEYDDWYKENKEEDIAEIVKELKRQYKVQSKRRNVEMEWIKWIVYPTLVKDKNYMYYSFLASDNGVKNPVVYSMIYDRNGYVKFAIVTKNLTASSPETEFRETVESALDLYTPDIGQRYADYSQGDKVYEYGIIGSLAALAGVSWKGKAKAVAAGIFATMLIFAKKLWWLIFVPFILIFKKLLKKKD